MLRELLGDDVKSAGYLERLQLLGTQLTRWASKAPKNKPTFREMLADGSFVPLPEILAKTLPSIVAAAQAFDGTSPSSAVAVRDAVVLAAVAGDGNPNERPGELTWVQDGAIGGGCVDPKVSSTSSQHFPPQTLIPTPPAVHRAGKLPRQHGNAAGGRQHRHLPAPSQDGEHCWPKGVDCTGVEALSPRKFGSALTPPRRRRARRRPRRGAASSARLHRCSALARRAVCSS